jgi:hypothetical protein
MSRAQHLEPCPGAQVSAFFDPKAFSQADGTTRNEDEIRTGVNGQIAGNSNMSASPKGAIVPQTDHLRGEDQRLATD